MAGNAPNLAGLVGALPAGIVPTAYAPLVQMLQTMMTDGDADALLEKQLARLQRRLRAQERKLARAQRTISAYRTQNRLLAQAHGACDCWGGNPSCRHCAGQGIAGWMAPQAELLRDLLGALPDEERTQDAGTRGAFHVHPENPPPTSQQARRP